MDQYAELTLVIFSFLLACTWIELKLLDLKEKKQAVRKEVLASFALGAGFLCFSYSVERYGLQTFSWVAEHRPLAIPLDGWRGGLLLFLGVEFCFYWYHRCSHRIRWFWASHSVHHTSKHINFAAAYRLAWTSGISGAFLFYLPLVWMGFSPSQIYFVLGLTLLYQVLLHTELVPRLGPLEKVLNTPSNHRVHHGINPQYRDRNFGNVLIIFDHLFGTYAAERPEEPSRYGLEPQLDSHNPVVIAFHEWRAMLHDVAHAKTWRARCAYVCGKPGWRVHDAGKPD